MEREGEGGWLVGSNKQCWMTEALRGEETGRWLTLRGSFSQTWIKSSPGPKALKGNLHRNSSFGLGLGFIQVQELGPGCFSLLGLSPRNWRIQETNLSTSSNQMPQQPTNHQHMFPKHNDTCFTMHYTHYKQENRTKYNRHGRTQMEGALLP